MDKVRAKNLKNTGYEYQFQRPEVIAKSHSKEAEQKRYATKRKRGTFNSSSVEETFYKEVHDILLKYFPISIITPKTNFFTMEILDSMGLDINEN